MPEIFQVDAFTDQPYSGNPAGVCLLSAPAETDWMRNVAAEMNLSETAFVYPEKGQFRLRWFTPQVEVELCGHATLATAHVLWETGAVGGKTCEFLTLSGLLAATRTDGGIELDFPALPPREADPPDMIAAALDVDPVWAGLSRHDWLIEVDSPDTVRRLNPDFAKLRELDVRGVIVTASGDGKPHDFVSRFFAPGAGINEDPVTGSAHCVLGPYWQGKMGKSRFNAWQASPRGGGMTVTVHGDRVLLQGNAITMMRGQWLR